MRLFLTLLAFPATSAFAVALVSDVSYSGRRANAVVTLAPFEAKTEFIAFDPRGKRVELRAGAVPTDLWILLDASVQCRALKVEGAMAELLQEVKRIAPSQSRLTLVAYHADRWDRLADRQPIASWAGLAPKCDDKAHSANVEKALSPLLKEKSLGMDTVVWIFTSGNSALSEKTIQQLKERQIAVAFVLYQPLVEREMRGAIDRLQNAMGEKRITFQSGLINKLPLWRYRFEIAGQEADLERATTYTIRGLVEGKESITIPVVLQLPGGFSWERGVRYVVLFTAVGLLAWAIYRVIRFYRGRKCARCQRKLRHRDPVCLFCLDPVPFVTGRFNQHDVDLWGQPDCVPLVHPVSVVGPHRRAAIRFMAPGASRRKPYAQIVREESPSHGLRFRLVPLPGIRVAVNGYTLTQGRFLKSGDALDIGGIALQFFFLAGRQS